jgi:hypothetical protein
MSYALAWHAASERDLRDLSHWRTAERIASAMMRFAETGEGAVEYAGKPGLYRCASAARSRYSLSILSPARSESGARFAHDPPHLFSSIPAFLSTLA